MKKYLTAIVSGFIAYLAATLVFPLFSEICYSFYVILRGFVPTLPLYSSILQKEEYVRLMATINAAAVLPSLLLMTFIVARLQNKRYENITASTGGLYTMKEGIAFYFPRYIAADVLGAALPPIAFFTAYYFIPEPIIERYISPLVAFTSAPIEFMGFWQAAVALTSTFILLVPIKALYALICWRSAWLSEGSIS